MFDTIKKLFAGTILMFSAFGVLCIFGINLFNDFITWNIDSALKTTILIVVLFAFQITYYIHYYFSLYLFTICKSFLSRQISINGENKKIRYKKVFFSFFIFKTSRIVKKLEKSSQINKSPMKSEDIKKSQIFVSTIEPILILLCFLLIIKLSWWFFFLVLVWHLYALFISLIQYSIYKEIGRFFSLFEKKK